MSKRNITLTKERIKLAQKRQRGSFLLDALKGYREARIKRLERIHWILFKADPITASTLLVPIPSQYAQQGVAFSYQIPLGTFSGAPTLSATCNRTGSGRRLPLWLSFNPGNQTFTGTPTRWRDFTVNQIVVKAEESAGTSYCIFMLTTGSSENVGRQIWRAGNIPDFTINAANIGGFDPATVTTGKWVAIAVDLTKTTLSAANFTKIVQIRTNGGYLVWLFRDENGLSGHQTYRFDFDYVFAGETLALDFSLGDIKSLQVMGRLWRGLRGKEIYITNYNEIGNITSKTWNNVGITTAVLFSRQSDNLSDKNIRVVGQPGGPNRHTPFINLYGVGVKTSKDETGTKDQPAWQNKSGQQGYIESAYVLMDSENIGWHWKTDISATSGDRRPSMNKDGWDHNMKYMLIHDCYSVKTEGEGMYLGGGEFRGSTVPVYHYLANGTTPKMITVGGVSVQEYHNERRYYHQMDYIAIEWNIVISSGWDNIQLKDCTKEGYIMYNFCLKSAVSNTVTLGQSESIMADAAVCEIAYNWCEKGWGTGLRVGMIGQDSIHHNIVFDTGNVDYTPGQVLDPLKGGLATYGANRGAVNIDYPAVDATAKPDYVTGTTYPFDNQVDTAQVKYLGLVYRSIQAGNVGHQPNISATWWVRTFEETAWNARVDLADGDLYWLYLHNTHVTTKGRAFEHYTGLPSGALQTKNNKWINCGTNTTLTGGGDKQGNIILHAQATATWFTNYATRDFRVAVGSPAISAGVDLTALVAAKPQAFSDGFLDYGGKAHTATPTVGAFENNSFVNDAYSWIVNGQAGTNTPAPISIDAGPDLVQTLPLPNGINITAVKSVPGRVLTSILWTQTAGPNNLTLNNSTTITVTALGFDVGFYTLNITTVDEYGQTAQNSVNITANQVQQYSSFQWYEAPDLASAPNIGAKTAVVGATGLTHTPETGANKWFAREETPISQSGTIIGAKFLSNWVKVT